MNTTDGKEWMTINMACGFYGVSRRTLYNWIAAGKVTVQHTPGGSPRVLVDTRPWEEPKAANQ
jgi:predicted site-specific integrase-resolvase